VEDLWKIYRKIYKLFKKLLDKQFYICYNIDNEREQTRTKKGIKTVKQYFIFIHSNEHPRTINSYQNQRCYYSRIDVLGKDALKEKVAELRAKGEIITDIRTELGLRIWM
jgi:hypothetical protein